MTAQTQITAQPNAKVEVEIETIAQPVRAAKRAASDDSHRALIDRIKTVPLASRVAQVVVWMDSAGVIHAEAPGQNGARKKVEGFDGHALRANCPELFIELTVQANAARDAKAAPTAGELARRRDAEKVAERERIAQESRRRFAEWYNGLTKQDREAYDAKVEASKAKQREAEMATAHSVWNRTAMTIGHGVDLANYVIDDPARRPKSARRLTALAKGQNPKRRSRKFDPANVVDIKL